MGIFGGPSKRQIQMAQMKLQMEQAQKQADAKSKAQQIISLHEGMKNDSKCQALMDRVEKAMEANKDRLLSIACNPSPIKADNIGIFLYLEDPNSQPWDLDRKKTIKISYIEYGLSLTNLNDMAFMYWLLLRNPSLAYKDYRGTSRNMGDVLAHCLNIYSIRTLTTLYNTKKL